MHHCKYFVCLNVFNPISLWGRYYYYFTADECEVHKVSNLTWRSQRWLNGRADTLEPKHSGSRAYALKQDGIWYSCLSAREHKARKRRVPSDASPFRNSWAGKGQIWKHPKGNNSVKQLEVLMASKPFPREHSPRAGATTEQHRRSFRRSPPIPYLVRMLLEAPCEWTIGITTSSAFISSCLLNTHSFSSIYHVQLESEQDKGSEKNHCGLGTILNNNKDPWLYSRCPG